MDSIDIGIEIFVDQREKQGITGRKRRNRTSRDPARGREIPLITRARRVLFKRRKDFGVISVSENQVLGQEMIRPAVGGERGRHAGVAKV